MFFFLIFHFFSYLPFFLLDSLHVFCLYFSFINIWAHSILHTFIAGNCGDPRARPDSIGRFEPKPGTPPYHYITLSKTCGSDFNLGQAHKHLHLTKCIYNEGIPCLFKMIYKIDVQSSNCFYKISMFKNNGVNAYVGAYSAFLSL